MRGLRFYACLLALCMCAPALAFRADTPLADAAQEARAKALFNEIRCVVCQGESIADSPSDVAAAMRREIRAQLEKGESDAAITGYLVSRYGDAVLMRPPLKAATLPLWFAPLAILGLGAFLARGYFRRRT